MEAVWKSDVEDKFKTMIEKMPLFQRRIAEKMVKEEVIKIAKEENLEEVSEKVLVQAFFKKVPSPFKGLMKQLLEEAQIDYKQYGYK